MFGYNVQSNPNSTIIVQQLSGAISRAIDDLHQSGKIDINQHNQLKLLAQEALPQYAQQLIAMYPQGIPSNVLTSVVTNFINQIIQQYNARFVNQQSFNYQQPYQSTYQQPQTFTQQPSMFTQTQQPQQSTNIFTTLQQQSTTQDVPPVTKDDEIEESESKCTIKRRNKLKIELSKTEYQQILNSYEFKDSYNNTYYTGEILFTGSIFNSRYEAINAITKINKNLCSKVTNWLLMLTYNEFLSCNIEYSQFKEQYDKVRTAVMSNRHDIDAIVTTLFKQSHDFVLFWSKHLVEDINKRIRRFMITDEHFNPDFYIKTLEDIPLLFELEVTKQDDPIIQHPKFKTSLTSILYNAFDSYFNKLSIGVLDPETHFNHLIFCDDLILIEDQTKQQYLKQASKIENKDTFIPSVVDVKKNVMITNVLISQKEILYLLQESDILILDTYQHIDNDVKLTSIETLTSKFSTNFELLMSEVYSDDCLTDIIVIGPNKEIYIEIGVGRTLDGNIVLFKE